MEADEEKRAEYLRKIGGIGKEQLVYVDESGVELNLCKDRGWGKKGTILSGKKSGKYYERTNVIAGYTNHQSIAPMVFSGSCNMELFNQWVRDFLIKELNNPQL